MSENNQTSEQVTPTPPTPSKNGSMKWLIIGVLAVALIAVLAFTQFGDRDGVTDGTGANALDANKIIAQGDNITVTRGELDEKLEQVRRSLPSDATNDPTQDGTFELQLLEDLISLKLLTAEAEAKNFTVTDDELNAEITLLEEQFGGREALDQQLEAFGISNDELRENMRNELMIRQLLEEETSIGAIEVTDEEIAEAYSSAVGDAEDAPPLEQVSELLRSEIVNQKSAEIIQEYVQQLRSEVNIEVTL